MFAKLRIASGKLRVAGERYSTPCITAKEGGCVIKKISRSHRSRRSRGGFPLVSIGKPPRPRDQRMLRDIFIDRAATPPCRDARRGIALTARSSSKGGFARSPAAHGTPPPIAPRGPTKVPGGV